MRQCARCGATWGDDVMLCPVDGADTTLSTTVRDVSTLAGAPSAGDQLGAYVLKELLGQGDMALVYLAEHIKLSRKVALKLLRPELAQDPVAVRRFFAEARIVNEIAHENIVEITDFVDEGAHHFFVMELLKGQALSDVLKREGRLSLSRALHVGAQIASALAAAHAANVVHRDVKPQNIFLIERGGDRDFVKVLDFGIAKVRPPADPLGAQATIKDVKDVKEATLAGSFLGTPAYAAPEQLMSKPVDQRADIYSFALLMFEAVSGARPFRRPTVGEVVLASLMEPAPSLQSVMPDAALPAELVELVRLSLQKDPEQRPASMAAVRDALATLARAAPPLGADPTGEVKFAAPVSARWATRPEPTRVDARPDGADDTLATVDSGDPLNPALDPMLDPTVAPALPEATVVAARPTPETSETSEIPVTVVAPMAFSELPDRTGVPQRHRAVAFGVAALVLGIVGGAVVALSRFGGPAEAAAATVDAGVEDPVAALGAMDPGMAAGAHDDAALAASAPPPIETPPEHVDITEPKREAQRKVTAPRPAARHVAAKRVEPPAAPSAEELHEGALINPFAKKKKP